MNCKPFPTGYRGAFPTDVTQPMPTQTPGSTGPRSAGPPPQQPPPAPRPNR
jgi:hypothetical protein